MGEPSTLWDRVVKKSASALASGALQPIQTRSVTLVDGGVRFLTRIASCSLEDCVDRALEDAAEATRKRYLQLLADVGRETIRGPTTFSPRVRGWSLSRGPGKRASPFRVNALGYAGALFVRDEGELEKLRRIGPMKLLGEVGLRTGQPGEAL